MGGAYTLTDGYNSQPDIGETLGDVRQFWDSAPLWTGESKFTPGTKAFFEEHRATVHEDCFGGEIDEQIFPDIAKDSKILDLGCGIGFWLVEFSQRGFSSLYGADLSPNSLEIARQRCQSYGLDVNLSEQNAESIGFETASFDHVNCQGVVHHTPDPRAAIEEIGRILKPGGTASVSVYYKNIVIRNWNAFRWPSNLLSRIGAGLKGRGREAIYANDDVNDIIRQYDGAANPIGIAFDKSEFKELIGPQFEIDTIFYHFFPARSLPLVKHSRAVHRVLDRRLPFMIYGNIRKR